MIRVSIIGATGYAGAELLRLLYNHPQVQVVHITSESYTGKKISEVYPHLRGLYDQELISMKDMDTFVDEVLDIGTIAILYLLVFLMVMLWK